MTLTHLARSVFALWMVTGWLGASAADGQDVEPDAIPIASPQAEYAHTFKFNVSKLSPRPHSVCLAGSFNHFSHTENPMHDDGGGEYSATLRLKPDVYHYKFLVDGSRWFTDPAADRQLEDQSDHGNSGVIIGPDARQFPPPLPNHIEPRGLAHDPADVADVNVASTTQLRLRVRTQANDVQSVVVLYRRDGRGSWERQPLFPVASKMGFDYFGGLVSFPQANQIDYILQLTDGSAVRFLASGVLCKSEETAHQHAYLQSMNVSFQTPEWTKHAVWYQIFPERFRNGDRSNDPQPTQKWTGKWYTTLPNESPGEQNVYKGEGNMFKRRYGGDIQGIQQELPYLRSLGVTALYLNPMFQADSLHKYDTRDYRHIDDHFGVAGSGDKLEESDDPATWKWSASDKVFLEFLQEAHRQGFKVIIDGVFNHVGKSHPFFQDVLKKGRASRYADWFVIYDWGTGGPPGKPGGIQYQRWEGRNGALPIWKKDAELGIVHGPREHIMAITRRWLAPDGDVSRGVDGFRLDAANEVPHAFWIDWRKLVKSINPDAYINGEVWSWAQPWLSGDQFDAVMNYQFAMPSQSFFVDQKTALTPSAFGSRLEALCFNYPWQVVLSQQNLFDSHDTDRFASRFLNPDLGYNRHNRLQEAGSTYNISKPSAQDWARDRQAVLFQMCFAGAPMIYYGDEAGMWGPSDPSDRMPMWWKDLEPFDDPDFKFNQEQFDWYQKCVAIHNMWPCLQTGSFRPILEDDERGVFAFERELPGHAAYIVLNRSAVQVDAEVPIDGTERHLVDWMHDASVIQADGVTGRPTLRVNPLNHPFENRHGKVSISLPPFGSAVLVEDGAR